MAKRILTPRTPAAEGPDVIYTDGSFDIYVNGSYCGSRVNSQDAWIEARSIHFDNLEAAAITTADAEAEIAETADLTNYAANWDTTVEHQRRVAEADAFVTRYVTDQATIDQPVGQRDQTIIYNLLTGLIDLLEGSERPDAAIAYAKGWADGRKATWESVLEYLEKRKAS